MLLIVTSTGDRLLDLSTLMTLNDLELQNRSFYWFYFAIFGFSAHFKSELPRSAWSRPS